LELRLTELRWRRSFGGWQLDPNVDLLTKKAGNIAWKTRGGDAFNAVAHPGSFAQDERLKAHKLQ